MPIRRFDEASFREVIRERSRPAALSDERAAVAEICARVFAEGDAALRELGKRFDGWAPGPNETFEVDMDVRIDDADQQALEFAAKRIRDFHSPSPRRGEGRGEGLELVTRPVQRAGVYAPGGRAVYPSTVLMT